MIRASIYDWVYNRWARWYLIRGYPGSTAGGTVLDADETVECTALTKAGARHLVRWSRPRGIHLRYVSKAEWQAEHETGLTLVCPTCSSDIIELVPGPDDRRYERRCINGHSWDVRTRGRR